MLVVDILRQVAAGRPAIAAKEYANTHKQIRMSENKGAY